jgi:tRNA pseudouridine13 synthase
VLPLPRGVIKSRPEDFVVEEVPLYEPSGQGDHLYVRFTKRELTTDVAVRMIARALGVNPRDVGVAGLKDKIGVTTQTISVPAPRVDGAAFDARARELALEGITVLGAQRHGNKLRTGHLAANTFTIVVRGVNPGEAEGAMATLLRLEKDGVPNLFGNQRFGRDGDNAVRARAWLEGKDEGPRDPKARRFLWSSLQSAIFNDVLRARLEDGTWATPVEGDVLQKTDSGGLFLCTDVQADRARAERSEVVVTGPIPGVKMKEPEGGTRALEDRVMRGWLGESFDLGRVRALGEGARRPLRLEVRDVRAELVAADPGEQAVGVRVYFVLPKGSYATTVLASAFTLEEAAPAPARASEDASEPNPE